MAQIFKRGNVWAYRVWIDSKHSKSKGGFKRKADAQKAALELEVKKSKNLLTQAEGISFVDYFTQWVETYKFGRISTNTEIRYKKTIEMIRDNFGDRPISEVSSFEYQKMIDAYGSTHAKASTSRINGYMRKAVQYAINDGLLSRDFTLGVIVSGSAPGSADLKFLELEEAAKLKQYCLDHWRFKEITYCQILFGLLTGCRYGEVCGLTWDCIDFKNNKITINKSYDYLYKTGFKATKTESSMRTIQIDSVLLRMLKQLQLQQKEYFFAKSFGNPDNLVFLSNRHDIISNNGVNKALQKILKEIGATTIITFHGLRHTHASMLIANHVSVDYIAERLGHSDTMVTIKTYSHLLQKSREEEEQKSLKFLENL